MINTPSHLMKLMDLDTESVATVDGAKQRKINQLKPVTVVWSLHTKRTAHSVLSG